MTMDIFGESNYYHEITRRLPSQFWSFLSKVRIKFKYNISKISMLSNDTALLETMGSKGYDKKV